MDMWAFTTFVEHRQGLAHPNFLTSTKNKDGSFDKHEGLRDTKILNPSWLKSFIFYMKPVYKGRERWLLYLILRNRLSQG